MSRKIRLRSLLTVAGSTDGVASRLNSRPYDHDRVWYKGLFNSASYHLFRHAVNSRRASSQIAGLEIPTSGSGVTGELDIRRRFASDCLPVKRFDDG